MRQRSFPAGRRTASRRMPSIRYPSGSSRSTALSCRDTAPKTRRTHRSPVRSSVTFSSSGNSSARSNGDSSPVVPPRSTVRDESRTQSPGRLRSSRSTTVESRRAAIRATVTDFVRLHSTTGSSTTRSARHAVRATNAHNNKNRFITQFQKAGRTAAPPSRQTPAGIRIRSSTYDIKDYQSYDIFSVQTAPTAKNIDHSAATGTTRVPKRTGCRPVRQQTAPKM